MEKNLTKKFHLELKYDPTGAEYKNKSLFVHGKYNSIQKARCIKKLGIYHFYAFSTWGGNGFGNNSEKWLVDTENGVIYYYYGNSIKEFIKHFQKQIDVL